MSKAVNVLGALSLVLGDEIRAAVNETIGTSGEAGAAIVMLGAHPGLSVGQVAAALDMSHSGCVRVVDRLEADGLLVRKAGATHRLVSLELTPEGRRRRLIALKHRDRVLRQAAAGLSQDETEMLEALASKMLKSVLTDKGQSYRFCRMCNEGECVPSGCPVEERWAELTG
ncbi:MULTISPECIES: MarR family winged helix-turn-helix transcriptional regulator [unclassified Aureimonas]|uniref:MarR family winged helix-turn-helix transcriptional regulator n=1 Tax=unclassified Aureimonas TaxID=2615206 RepID=UPI0006FF338B|nr:MULTISPECIES: MarR family winged helix-turn-helix transcriptional regulator [unclassified Aureimonas]KQT65971.1 hypothetical protein ASG62_20860 [Aureimonas sp. Leaf427]KQT73330.1 hypothetical protein ASG54_17340 [Aureimonas sp. Leaf460]